MNKELAYWVATSAIPGVGSATFSYLHKKFKSLKKFWEARDSEIQTLKIDVKTKASIIDFRNKVDPKIYLEKVYSAGIKVVARIDRDYPANLRQLEACPAVLYFRGNLLPQDDLAVAVVGSRNATIYGRQITEKLVFDLAKNGLTIVSGLARGIDSVAHRMAIDSGGRTIAVLGSGLDNIYPPENRRLAEEVVKNGAIVSEFPLGFPALPNNFTARNRIISGLSLGVLVTEAAVDSGSLITAGYAAEQGREVFAVPGPVTSKTSEGANNLIKDGVHVATSAEDILEVLDIERKRVQLPVARDQGPKDKNQAAILAILDGGTKHVDAIAKEVKLPIEQVSAALSMMELSGFVKNYGSGIWGV
ncbi:MAG: protecting protein DprA protein [Candidatus Curtissbacteria bacterium GW2011_GWA1_40_16]|uniref:Protecting protein DprA protein n=1 Tax=Candidatus Curtissbacteria bacterium GW2011_GWA1_40_16 TaxID=1618405 RepID=A0A0G0RMV7_9BACT|nr:MAG: protecting protein DprA protein [Candidatus Curtissbacteria bacterium GW2011_GWA1_40_16]